MHGARIGRAILACVAAATVFLAGCTASTRPEPAPSPSASAACPPNTKVVDSVPARYIASDVLRDIMGPCYHTAPGVYDTDVWQSTDYLNQVEIRITIVGGEPGYKEWRQYKDPTPEFPELSIGMDDVSARQTVGQTIGVEACICNDKAGKGAHLTLDFGPQRGFKLTDRQVKFYKAEVVQDGATRLILLLRALVHKMRELALG